MNDAIAIGAAWLDAELFIRNGDTSCKHSVRLMGYNLERVRPPTKPGHPSPDGAIGNDTLHTEGAPVPPNQVPADGSRR